jgi:hypothetical protein
MTGPMAIGFYVNAVVLKGSPKTTKPPVNRVGKA